MSMSAKESSILLPSATCMGVLYYTVLHCTVLYCTVLYCTCMGVLVSRLLLYLPG